MQNERSERLPEPMFDLREGERQREQGQDLANTKAGDVLNAATQIAIEIGRREGFCTADDVYREMKKLGLRWDLLGPRAGSLFRNRCWRWDGATIKSSRVSNHARLIRVWVYQERI